MRPVEHRREGDPQAPYEPTKADHRRQEEAERVHEYVKRVVADAPPMTPGQIDKVRRTLFSYRTPDHELMRWRLRLYCGHIIEATAHHTSQQPGGPRSCPECGLEPASVVAFESIGLVAEPPGPEQPSPPPTPRSPRRSAEQRRIIELEEEVTRLRARLGEAEA